MYTHTYIDTYTYIMFVSVLGKIIKKLILNKNQIICSKSF